MPGEFWDSMVPGEGLLMSDAEGEGPTVPNDCGDARKLVAAAGDELWWGCNNDSECYPRTNCHFAVFIYFRHSTCICRQDGTKYLCNHPLEIEQINIHSIHNHIQLS